jgi:hypothetical protein
MIQAIWHILPPAVRRYGSKSILVILWIKVDTMNDGDGILFNTDGEIAAQAIIAALTQSNLRVIRSFDLRAALGAHSDCACPYHGTSHCACQFVVLLVYGDAAGPVVVTAHSHETQAHVRVVQDALTHPNPPLAGQVMAILRGAALAWTAAATPPAEVTADV